MSEIYFAHSFFTYTPYNGGWFTTGALGKCVAR